jgi:hypothetical protein
MPHRQQDADHSRAAELGPAVQVYKGQKSGFEGLVKKARFCLAPYGWGWGIRISEVGAHGGGWCCWDTSQPSAQRCCNT